MTKKLSWVAPALILAAAFLLVPGDNSAAVDQDRLWHHRNLGKAYYENPNSAPQAVEEFRKALQLAPNSFRERLNYGLALLRAGRTNEGVAELEKVQKQNPSVPHTWFNLGIAYKRDGRSELAIGQFQRMIELVPSEPVCHYNLGLLYSRTGKEELALKQLAMAARLDPNFVAPRYLIFNIHRAAGRQREAAQALQIFQETKRRQKEADESEDPEWCFYAEVYDTVEPQSAANTDPAFEPRFADRRLDGAADPKTAGAAVLDLDGDARSDLLIWSSRGVRAYRNGSQPVAAGLDTVRAVSHIAVGDYNNDGLADLAIATSTDTTLYENRKGTFARSGTPLPAGRLALWLDYDHDYDPDLFVFGTRSMLFRNQGSAGFHDRSADFPFVTGRVSGAAALRLIPDTKGFDLAVAFEDRAGVLYRDRLQGAFEAVPLDPLPRGTRSLIAFDVDNDGWIDLAHTTGLLVNRDGKFTTAAVPAQGPYLLFADLGNRGFGDLLSPGSLHRNRGLGRFSTLPVPAAFRDAIPVAAADLDNDGRVDIATISRDGSIHLLSNRIATGNQHLRVQLTGVKNMKLAPGSEIEVKIGPRYQKRMYDGTPLLIGLRSDKIIDTIRITWPNGMIQNVPKQAAGQAANYQEAPRLSGSCPMIFTWDGRQFRFITDVLGVAPLGASSGDGSYFPVDHDEYIQIPSDALALKDGRYEVRITEELREVSYIDEVRLIAVDHPAQVDIFTNDKFKAPPFPDFRLFGVSRRLYPLTAFDGEGRDVWNRIRWRDRVYPDQFRRNHAGVAELHALELDFGAAAAADNQAVLILNGWVDWADGSTFLGAAQQGDGGLIMPYLQVKDAGGEWHTVIGDMGIPAGKPKTITVDLTGRFLSASRQVRIVTNLCLYWDEVFLSEETGPPPVRMTPLQTRVAGLRFRGFSKPVIHPERKQPETFVYSDWMPVSMWNPTPGLYTRFGDVRELLESVDDRFVIMGSGDELGLEFEAAALPPLQPGWKRDFLLLVDGWAKDGDANTAYSQAVQPLPFHAMSRYPYGAGERFPDTDLHSEYLRKWVVRPALQLIRPLR
jgi:tetratricopeptide (TPR) repeat protein